MQIIMRITMRDTLSRVCRSTGDFITNYVSCLSCRTPDDPREIVWIDLTEYFYHKNEFGSPIFSYVM